MAPHRDDDSPDLNEADNLGPVFKHFLKLLLRFYPMILAYLVLVLTVAGSWIQLQTPLYQATTTILVDPTLVSNAAEKQSLENLALQATLISAPGILNKVVERYNLNSIYPFNKSGNPVADIQANMNVRPNMKSKTIEISFLFISREEAAKIANAIAETYVYSSEEKSQGATRESLESLRLSFSQELAKQEDVKAKIEEFQKQFPEAEDEINNSKKVDYFNQEITRVDAEMIEVKTKILEIEQYQKETGSIFNHPYILENPIIDKQTERLRVAEGNLDELKSQFRAMHPDVIAAQARVDSLKRSMLLDQEQIFQQFKLELKTRESMRERLRIQLEVVRDAYKKFAPQKAKMKNLIEEEAAIDKTIKLIQDRMSIASVEGGLKRPGVEIISRAKVPEFHAWPNKRKIFTTVLMLGLLSSFGIIFVYCYFDRSMRGYEDVETVTGKLFLGDLHLAKVKKGQLYPEFPNDKSFILFTHGVRLIATNIEFVLSDRRQKCVLFSSAIANEGKSFVSFHIAQSMARQGKKVILIDADFCQSTLRHQIPRTECELHLQEYLAGSAEIGDIIEGTDNELIHFIRSGGRASFSAPHALKSNRMKDLLNVLRENYDYVLVDTPPILPVNDTLALSQLVDMRVIVVRWGSTHRDLVRRAVSKIAPGQLILAGVMLNQVKEINEKEGYHIYRPN